MKGNFLLNRHQDTTEPNIYADKSALVLYWLLANGINFATFSLREVAINTNVSLGLVQRVFTALVNKGILVVEGVRTAKKFSLKKPKQLFKDWLDHYSIVKKCKMRTYRTGFWDIEDLLQALKKLKIESKIALDLHTAAEALQFKNSNLNTLELYLLDSSIRTTLEETLQLQPQERGYEVLLIEPYYKGVINSSEYFKGNIRIAPPLLTFLDLYHFPLRGLEQAQFMAVRIPQLKRLIDKTFLR